MCSFVPVVISISALVGSTFSYPSMSIAFSVTVSPNVWFPTTLGSDSVSSVPCSL